MSRIKAILLALAALLFMAALPAASAHPPHFTGYCACGCSFVKDCNTSSDCGGAGCLKAPTCCLSSR